MNDSTLTTRLKICFVARFHYTERVGGAEVQAWLLARKLVHRGHDVSYICESLTGQAGKTQTVGGVEIIWLSPHTHLDLLSLPSHARALARINPDVVIHRYTSGYESVIGRFCRRKSAKFVWICTDNASPVRNYFLTRQREILKWYPRPLHKRLVLLLYAWIKDRSREYGMQFVTHPCVQNMVQAKLFQDQFGKTPFHFPSGHEIPGYLATKDQPPVVLWVASFSAGKRPELFAKLARACRDLEATFLMISKKIPTNAHITEAQIRHLASANTNFRWLIDVPFEEVQSWFERASVFVNTSLEKSEGFPNTFVQAWSRGVPVVSFGVDPDEILRRHNLGKCVNTIDEARCAILNYTDDPNISQTRARLQDAARQYFSIETVANRLLEIIETTKNIKKYDHSSL